MCKTSIKCGGRCEWKECGRCLFAHTTDELRRDPLTFFKEHGCLYSCQPCPAIASGGLCTNLRCLYAHSSFEQQFHPLNLLRELETAGPATQVGCKLAKTHCIAVSDHPKLPDIVCVRVSGKAAKQRANVPRALYMAQGDMVLECKAGDIQLERDWRLTESLQLDQPPAAPWMPPEVRCAPVSPKKTPPPAAAVTKTPPGSYGTPVEPEKEPGAFDVDAILRSIEICCPALAERLAVVDAHLPPPAPLKESEACRHAPMHPPAPVLRPPRHARSDTRETIHVHVLRSRARPTAARARARCLGRPLSEIGTSTQKRLDFSGVEVDDAPSQLNGNAAEFTPGTSGTGTNVHAREFKPSAPPPASEGDDDAKALRALLELDDAAGASALDMLGATLMGAIDEEQLPTMYFFEEPSSDGMSTLANAALENAIMFEGEWGTKASLLLALTPCSSPCSSLDEELSDLDIAISDEELSPMTRAKLNDLFD